MNITIFSTDSDILPKLSNDFCVKLATSEEELLQYITLNEIDIVLLHIIDDSDIKLVSTVSNLVSYSAIVTLHTNLNEKLRLEMLNRGAWASLELPITNSNFIEKYFSCLFDKKTAKLESKILKDIIDNLPDNSIELENKELLLRQIVDLVPHLLFARDSDGKHLLVNKAFANLVGLTPKDIIGKTLQELDIFQDNEIEQMLKDDATVIDSCKELRISEQVLNIKKGKTSIREVIKIPFNFCSLDKKCIKAILGLSMDITDRKNVENKLEAKYIQLYRTLRETVKSLSFVVQFNDPYTYGHQRNVSNIAGLIAKQLELPDDEINGIKTAGLLHDIGKLAIPKELLTKPSFLRTEEFDLIKYHAYAGHEITKNIPFCQPIAMFIYQHHERLDGSGYPYGLKEEDILFGSQILAVADTFEAMATHRPYRPAKGIQLAIKELKKFKGIKYNTLVVDTLLNLIDSDPSLFESLNLVYTNTKLS